MAATRSETGGVAFERIELEAPYHLTPYDVTRDIDELVEAFNDERVTATLAGPPKIPYTREDAKSFITEIGSKTHNGLNLVWCIRDGDGKCVGAVDVRPSEVMPSLRNNTDRFMDHMGVARIQEPFCAFGFWLHPDHQGRRLMTKAVKTLIESVCVPLGVRVVTGDACAGNWASRRTFELCGFEFVGTVHQAYTKPTTGVVHDLWYFKRVLEPVNSAHGQ